MADADPRDRIDELAAALRAWREEYYAGEPSVDDATFDAAEDELRGLLAEHPDLTPADNPLDQVGAAPSGARRAIRHARPMLSLAKVSPANREEGVREFAQRFPGQPLRVTPKLDGVSLSIVFQDGALEYVATRGDGTTGEEVTSAARAVIPELPTALGDGAAGRVEVRGEAVMLQSTFDAYNAAHPDKPLANPRNACAGTLLQKDPAAAAEAGRVLRFYAFDVHAPEATDLTVQGLADRGFHVPAIEVVEGADAVLEVIAAIEAARPTNDFDIDGAVVQLDAAKAFAAAGNRSSTPRGAVAVKLAAEERETVLRDISWEVGPGGKVVPRAVLEPVFVGGTTVSSATLANQEVVRARGVKVGMRVLVKRAGDVIPFVSGPAPGPQPDDVREAEIPTHCPSCGTELVEQGNSRELFCTNLDCPAQTLRRLQWWAGRAAADMEAVGEVWIAKLYEDGVLRTPADFYAITAEQLMEYDRMGEVSSRRFVESIERSKDMGLRRALIGFGIRHAREGTAKRLCQAGFGSVEEIAAASAEDLAAVKDIGPIVARSIADYFARPEVAELVAALRAHGVSLDVRDEDRPVEVAAAADTPLKGATVVVTGAIVHPDTGEKVARPAFVRLLEQAGATSASSVSASTTFLITGNDVGASKTAKAQKLEVAVVDQAQAWGWLADAGVS
ncbi:NAD-dependent DNA ligase LigA [Paraconexibacter algicola]|uniref:DNA ligase n=1 Tax=Paraconexibacter algicola TaxID=2133960 RepID=A0A2T4UJ01_9ACTN|nr:NAD-dependent DNA ligase LigA [Paraconexibacter algicola]PTL59206.1 DNA ligase (NAD(+)) LigA [Paraconexibacter algicola]